MYILDTVREVKKPYAKCNYIRRWATNWKSWRRQQVGHAQLTRFTNRPRSGRLTPRLSLTIKRWGKRGKLPPSESTPVATPPQKKRQCSGYWELLLKKPLKRWRSSFILLPLVSTHETELTNQFSWLCWRLNKRRCQMDFQDRPKRS